MKWKQYLQLILAVLLIGFCIWIAVLILPALQRWLPVISNLAGLLVVVFLIVLMVSLVLTPLAMVHHFHAKSQIAQIEARKLNVTERGYMQGYVSISARDRLLVPAITMHSPEVPAHVHIQEDHSNKGGSAADWREALAREKLEWEREKFQMLNAPAQALLPAPRPSVEEIVEQLSDEVLEFSPGTSLTTQQLIKVELAGRHVKIIGGSQMGKSSLTGAILDQIRRKYSPSQVRLAILDLEDMTGALFEDAPHILEMKVDGESRKVHARNPQEVAVMLTWLGHLMNYRYELIQSRGLAYVERQPRILIYFEEFLDWKKTLAQRVPDSSLRDAAIAAINTLSTRGLKVGMHLLICAQVDYADKELQSAMAQFVGINVAFCVKPKAAQAAGFTDNERLNENYAAKTPGRYVIEMIGGGDMGVSPEFNVKEKVKQIQAARMDDEVIEGEIEELQLLPNSANQFFQTQQRKTTEDLPEDHGEASGRRYTADDLSNPLVLKKFLNEAGKMRAEGMSIDAILKSYDMSPGGRNNQNLKSLLDGQAANE